MRHISFIRALREGNWSATCSRKWARVVSLHKDMLIARENTLRDGEGVKFHLWVKPINNSDKGKITSHRIASHRIASHRITSHHIASHRIASHRKLQSELKTHNKRTLKSTFAASLSTVRHFAVKLTGRYFEVGLNDRDALSQVFLHVR